MKLTKEEFIAKMKPIFADENKIVYMGVACYYKVEITDVDDKGLYGWGDEYSWESYEEAELEIYDKRNAEFFVYDSVAGCTMRQVSMVAARIEKRDGMI